MDLFIDSSVSSMNYWCRTCMTANSILLNIFEGSVNNTSIAEILMSCTSVNVSKNDALPKSICQHCYDKLNSFYEFRISVEKNDTKFREFMEQKPNLSPGCIENENVTLGEVKIEIEVMGRCKTVCVKEENIETDISTSDTDNKVFVFDNTTTKIESKDVYANFETQNSDEKYACKMCSKKFRNLSNYQRHIKTHLNKRTKGTDKACKKDVIKCDVCASIFESATLLLSHMSIHRDGKGFTCKVNGDSENTRDGLETVNSSTDDVQCEVCNGKFKSKNSLSAHMRIHAQKGRILACSICGKVFNKISHLKRHEYSHEDKRPFKCKMCRKSYPTQEMLQEHTKHHNDAKTHVCPVCQKGFINMAALNTHIKIHTRDKLYLCPTCGKRFDSSTNLNQHVKRHGGIKDFACPLCPKKFISKGELKSHGISHTGERSFKCTQCNALFSKHSSLVLHNMRHQGVKPHQCDTCPMKFTTRSHLKRHYRIHTGEKPYRCDICDRAFTQSNDLVKHRRGHLGDKIYKCNECTESFRLKSELSHHYVTHARDGGDIKTNEIIPDHIHSKEE